MELSGLRHIRSGKVRDLYDVGDDRLLLVASDRVSTYDVVHPTPIPDKGRVLTALSAYWLGQTGDIVDSHIVSFSSLSFPEDAAPHADFLRGRTMLVHSVDIVPFECVARGYLVGSGWKEYQQSRTVCGIELPAGLIEAEELPEPIFTPATKAESGHDENVPFEYMDKRLPAGLAGRLRDYSLALYSRGRAIAREKGIILADTKFEFGMLNGDVVLADEVMTPDSSRYWPADLYEPGTNPPSYDKQFVRDFASSTGWDKKPPAPELPEDIVAKTRDKYLEAHERLTGESLVDWLARN